MASLGLSPLPTSLRAPFPLPRDRGRRGRVGTETAIPVPSFQANAGIVVGRMGSGDIAAGSVISRPSRRYRSGRADISAGAAGTGVKVHGRSFLERVETSRVYVDANGNVDRTPTIG
ncbi:hypothetical protein BUALT_Bualt01G0097200 [Buddleja alternifolia]|uniref:Uncharacterized protein n=1 Tax=Buddleja alternifolia TaxID=168488 RepID=A0AAV6YGN8_9LAMI|nr:hypothetical protein BUALT_Bualt01G0097200 [Buddleja alternifolia]